MEQEEKLQVRLPFMEAVGNLTLVKVLNIEGYKSKTVGLDGKPFIATANKTMYIVVSVGPKVKEHDPRIEPGIEVFPPQIPMHEHGGSDHGKPKMVDMALQEVYDHYNHERYAILDCYQIYGLNKYAKEIINLVPCNYEKESK